MNDAIKGALVSKTMWFNCITMAIGGIDWITNHSILIGTLVPQSGVLLVIIGAVGTILRAITSQPLSEKVE